MSLKALFTYSTVKEIDIPNPWVAFIYRVTQLIILCYIIGYELILNRAFQTFEPVTSAVTTKVKGIGLTSPLNNLIRENFYSTREEVLSIIHSKFTPEDKIKFKVFDTSDYIVPPNEFNSLFIMTNFVETKQSIGTCEESLSKGKCFKDQDCLNPSIQINLWHGLPTGKCITSKIKNNTRVCQINGWCPIENEIKNSEKNLLLNTLSYTIFIKNDVEFKKFDRKERNIFEGITNDYISRCKFNLKNDTKCPVFELDYILQEAEPDPEERFQMLLKGGVIEININWDCNYDFYAKKCIPQYTFNRMDVKFKKASSSSGFNFRFSNKYRINGTEHRDLYKAYGLRIVFTVTGKAGKFHVIPLMNAIGSGLGVLSLSVVLADCLVKNFSTKKLPVSKYKKVQTDENILKVIENGKSSTSE